MTKNTSSTPSPRCGAIMLMGVTGSGKSTFIASLTKENSRVGKSLESCTRICEAIEYNCPGDNFYQPIFLIDTPGFDDTSRSETQILQEIAGALQVLTYFDVDLYGIIYLHRITDPRVSGAAMKSLRVLEKICGENAYKNVFLVTTMWDRLENIEAGDRIGDDREAGLCEKPFWGTLREKQARTIRLNTPNKPLKAREMNENEIVKLLVHSCKPVRLLIQEEMGESREIRYLGNTSAGAYLEENMDALQRRHVKDLAALQRELEDAADSSDQEMILSVKEDLVKSIDEIERIEDQRRVFRPTNNPPDEAALGSLQVPQQPPETTTPNHNPALEASQPSRKQVTVTASTLNEEFEALRNKYKSLVSERGRELSVADGPLLSGNIGQSEQATSDSPSSDDNDPGKDQKSLDESNHTDASQQPPKEQKFLDESEETGASKQQSSKAMSQEVQSAGSSQSGASLGRNSQQIEALASSTGGLGEDEAPSGIVKGKNKKIFRRWKEKSPVRKALDKGRDYKIAIATKSTAARAKQRIN